MIVYRLLISLAAPAIVAWQGWRQLRGIETAADLAERMGWAGPPKARRVLWVHGASVGEVTSARALIEGLLAAHPTLHILATTNTMTGRATLKGWGLDRMEARLAPLDLRSSLRALLRGGRIAALLTLESEIWPNRLALLAARGIPVAVVGARLSERSASRWRRFAPRLVRRMLASLTLLSSQSEDSAARFRALGLPTASEAPPAMLKAAVTMPVPDATTQAAYAKVFPRGETVLAASTHPGEDGPILAAFAQACARRPGLRLILAPRHPERGTEIAALVRQVGLTLRQRSAKEAPDPDGDVYLADTLGEMALWYSLAGACFVGGSLVSKGGHTPYEPAHFGCAILHGPDVSNFADAYGDLAVANAAIRVANREDLANALASLDAGRSEALGLAALRVLVSDADATARAALVARLGAVLPLS